MFGQFWRLVRSDREFRNDIVGFVRGNEVTASGDAFSAGRSSYNFHYHAHLLVSWRSFTPGRRVRLYKRLKYIANRFGFSIDYSKMRNRWCKIIHPAQVGAKIKYLTKVASYSTKHAKGDKGGLVDLHPRFKSLLQPILKGLRMYGVGGVYADAVREFKRRDMLAVKPKPVLTFCSDRYLLDCPASRHSILSSASSLSVLPPMELPLLFDFIPNRLYVDHSLSPDFSIQHYLNHPSDLSSQALTEFLLVWVELVRLVLLFDS